MGSEYFKFYYYLISGHHIFLKWVICNYKKKESKNSREFRFLKAFGNIIKSNKSEGRRLYPNSPLDIGIFRCPQNGHPI
jgi:hypothetical protein